MERATARGGDFSNVDAHDAQALIAYLDVATDLGSQDKRESYRAQQLGTGMSVLDAGCGTGDDVRAIAALVGPTGSVVGIDSSIAMVAEAARRALPPNAKVVHGSSERLDFADASFDACRAERLFQHLSDPAMAARELYRVTKPGGSAFLIDQDWETLVVAGAPVELTHRIVRAYAARLADGCAGRNHRMHLRRAGFSQITSTVLVATPTLTIAFSQFLSAAIDYAVEDGAVRTDEAHAWLLALMQSDIASEFVCAVSVFFTLARKEASDASP